MADRGVRIPRADIPRIFQQCTGSERRRERLSRQRPGLSIVKHTLDAHGGRVEVDGVFGQGSVFTLVLPIRDRHPARCAGPHPITRSCRWIAHKSRRGVARQPLMPRILIVEDEPDIVRGLQFNLEARGFE